MGQSGGEPLDAELIRIVTEELQLLLASPPFVRSPVLSRLLGYLVEQRLKNDGPAPKAYAIATEALGRTADFDPSVDSYPRVMVGRLRALLDRHYAATPWLHRLRIPQGSYEIVVQYRAGPPTRSDGNGNALGAPPHGGPKSFVPARRAAKAEAAHEAPESAQDILRDGKGSGAGVGEWGALSQNDGVRAQGWWRWMLMAIAVAAAALMGGGAALIANQYAKFEQGQSNLAADEVVPSPLIDVAVSVSVSVAESRQAEMAALGRALDGKLSDGIRRFEIFSVTDNGLKSAAKSRPDYRVDAMISGADQGALYITVTLNRTADARALWSRRLRLDAQDAGGFAPLNAVISQIGGDYGVIVRDQTGRAPDDYRAGYLCLAQFNRMRVTRQQDGDAAVADCLQKTAALQPRDPLPLAALSLLGFQRAHLEKDAKKAQALRTEAAARAAQAYDAEPSGAHGNFAQARASFYGNDCGPMRAMSRQAARANEYDADMAGRLGLYHAMCGDNALGEQLLRHSLALDNVFAAVPSIALAFVLAERGDAEDALKILTELANYRHVEAHYRSVYALALGRLGRFHDAAKQWKRLLALAGMSENASAEDVLRRFTLADLIVQREAAGLREAGVVPTRTKD